MNLEKLLADNQVSLESIAEQAEKERKQEAEKRALEVVKECQGLLSAEIVSRVESIKQLQKEIRTQKKIIRLCKMDCLDQLKKWCPVGHIIKTKLRAAGISTK